MESIDNPFLCNRVADAVRRVTPQFLGNVHPAVDGGEKPSINIVAGEDFAAQHPPANWVAHFAGRSALPTLAGDLLDPEILGTVPIESSPSAGAQPALNVLFLAHRVPYPLDKGERIRAYHEICALRAHGHRVHLVALCEGRNPPETVEALANLCASVEVVAVPILARRWRTVRALVGGTPLSCGHFASPTVRRIVCRHLTHGAIDLIVAFSSSMFQFVPVEWWAKTVADIVDSDAEKWLEFSRASRGVAAGVYRLEARRLRSYEDAIVGSSAASVVISDREACAFGSKKRPQVITAAVETARFVTPGPKKTASGNTPRILFLGAMSYRPNIDAVFHFATRVLPRIQSRVPGAEFLIVGHSPTRAVRRLDRLRGVRVTGRVPDVVPFLQSANVFVAPFAIARGVQNKVLESMAAGCPVVSSSAAVAGLLARREEHVLVADSAEAFADAVLRILTEPALASAIAARAREYVERVHSMDQFAADFAGLVAASARAGNAAIYGCRLQTSAITLDANACAH